MHPNGFRNAECGLTSIIEVSDDKFVRVAPSGCVCVCVAKTMYKLSHLRAFFFLWNLIKLCNLCWFWFLWPEKQRTKIVRIDFPFACARAQTSVHKFAILRISSSRTVRRSVPDSTVRWWQQDRYELRQRDRDREWERKAIGVSW